MCLPSKKNTRPSQTVIQRRPYAWNVKYLHYEANNNLDLYTAQIP